MTRNAIAHTFSIVAYDPHAKSWGIAVASKFLAVGALVPYAKSNVGAVATQSYVNTDYGTHGLELLAKGLEAPRVLEILLKEDKDVSDRQVGIVDRWGNVANFTGEMCSEWAGGLKGKNYTIQGNLLVSQNTIFAMSKAYENSLGNFEEKLFSALLAGDLAGGDKRGKQSASMLVVKEGGSYGGRSDRYLDLRVDNHSEPVRELGNLLELHNIFLGTSDENDKIAIDENITREFQLLLNSLGYYKGQVNGKMDKSTQEALMKFIDTENLEQRVDMSRLRIDRPALDYIRSNFEVAKENP